MKTFWQQSVDYLEIVLFSLNEVEITLGELLLVPAFIIGAILVVRWLIQFLVNRMQSAGVAPDVVHLVKRLLFVLAFVSVGITVLDLISVPLTAFAFVSGAVAIGVGFGAQNIINNFISGWILMWERPIRIGDFLEVDGVARGTVETINTRSTRIRRTDGVHMLMPNSKLLENTVVNWTLVDNIIRTSVKVGVAYGSDTKRVRDLIQQAATSQVEVLNTPEPVVIFDDFGDNALAFEVYLWLSARVERDLRLIRSNIRFSIDELFAENNIVIAFPQRDIHVDGHLTISSEDKLSFANKPSTETEQNPAQKKE
jgi:small-conductance mechanosensitive channel